MSRKLVRFAITFTLLSLVTISAFAFGKATYTLYYPDATFTDPCGYAYDPGSTSCVVADSDGCLTSYKTVDTYNFNCVIESHKCYQLVGSTWQQVTCP